MSATQTTALMNRLDDNKMKRTISTIAGLAAAAVVGGGAIIGLAGGAAATTPPPWEPDGNSVGGLVFYNAAGTPITGGDTSDPLAAYVKGTSTVRGGDNVATLYGYLPVNGQVPGQWQGEQLSGSTTYPNAGAPGALATAQQPVVTEGSGDETVADLVAAYPNTDSSSDGYAHIYQIRLLTSKPQEGISPKYDSADIAISGSTWSLLYSQAPATATSTALSMAPAGPVYHGSPVKLTATVSPSAAAGVVQFRDGTTVLKTVPVSGGSATFTETTLGDATHKLTARFVPATTAYATSTSAMHSLTVRAHPTAVTLKASKKKIKAGKKLTLTATETPAVAGKVTFLDGSKKLGKPVAVSHGKATLATSKLTKGKHKLVAKFSPKSKADDAPSTSKTVKVKVTG